MAKEKAPAAPAAGINTINRKRRNSFMRKCLSKSFKRMFAGSSSDVFQMLVKVRA